MKSNSMYVLDKVIEYISCILGVIALYGVVFKGAWWNILWVTICAAIAIASHADAKKEKAHGGT